MTAMISLLFWLAIIPFCIGLIPANFISPERRSPGLVILSGYFVIWAGFELAAVPMVLWVEYDNFKAASAVFTVLTILGAAAGIWLLYRNGKAGRPGLVTGKMRSGSKEESDTHVGQISGLKVRMTAFGKWLLHAAGIEWLLFFILLGFQLYKAVAFASFDGDDAYYVVESLIAQEAGVMYRILPLTGGSTGLDIRHALAVFPMWVAFVSVRAGVHATIVSHVVMPLVLIPLTYLLYDQIGCALFTKASSRPVFLIMMALFQIFGNVSIYTTETFFLTRTWQGKAVAGSLVIPAVLWLFLLLCGGEKKKNEDRRGLWILFVCVQMTAGICSSIAVFLVSVLTAITAFVLAFVRRDLKLPVKFGAACIPNMVYIAVYVFMAYSYLL
ncbi:MAG: hypothetical protein K2M22_08495 [Lachnospiraceae bacterium]|nr:hypothetical protein [Lachnospiraceae bacterium]MDE7177603.1 hypothetical protein [Lachnospiraceae bacterium]